MMAVALLAVIAAILIVALGGGSHGKGRTASPRGTQSAAQAASSYLGLGLSTVRRRLRNGETLEEIADSTPGHSAQGLLAAVGSARAAELRKHGATPAETAAAVHRARARLRAQLRRKRRSGALVRSAARYLGVQEAALRAQLRSGKTLTQVAEARGHTRAQLVEGMVRGRVAVLEAARSAGQITHAEEQAAIRLLRARIARAVDAKNL